MKIVVADQSDENILYLNIPSKPSFDNIELTDEQLELVAGGEFIVGGIIIVLTVFGVGVAGGYYLTK